MDVFQPQQSYKSILKGAIAGGIFGIMGILIAPLGLGIALVEFLRPILIPGIDLIVNQYFNPAHSRGATQVSDTTNLLVLGILFNVLIFMALGAVLALISSTSRIERKIKRLLTLIVILVFFAITGMLTNLYSFLVSPNKSWIFQIGA